MRWSLAQLSVLEKARLYWLAVALPQSFHGCASSLGDGACLFFPIRGWKSQPHTEIR